MLRYGVRREEEIGARLSNECYMNSTELIDNTMGDMPAMQIRAGWKRMWPRSRGERSHKVAGTNSRKEGTQGAQGRRRRTAVMTGHIGRALLPNNRAGDMLAMHQMHADGK